ncbi:MAG: FAD-binding protein, partial [Gammaproteobacteria bacterium]
PAIDYGRCCWCALCVDICPTGSIALSREYIHISSDLDTFFILPDPNGMHGFGFPEGWAKSRESDFLDLKRQPMPMLPPEERIQSFAEIALGYDDETAVLEASRCIQCGMCHDACPTHMDAPQYIRAIWEGEMEEAVRWIYRTNPFAHVCGRVCTHRCETACSIGRRGEPIAIRYLKRVPMDRVPHQRVIDIAAEGKAERRPGRVAVIGAGPAGLTAAFDLAKSGVEVVVFEGMPEPGGMPRYGIPVYRLPRERLRDDIDVIEKMGVEIRSNTWVGKDVTMEALERDFNAVILAAGLFEGRSTRIPGTDHPRVMRAVAFLRKVWAGEPFEVPKSLVVIGGGNVAMDVARTAARLQMQRYGAVQVDVVALEDRDHMLADPEEIQEAEEEGVRIHPSRGPKQCLIEEGALKGLETVRCLSVFDEQGRFHPKYDESDVRVFEAEMVVEAVGQMAKLDFLGEDIIEKLEWVRGRPKVDEEGRTALPWLWAAGDVVEGPDVIHAVAGGHRVAKSILRHVVEVEHGKEARP